MKLTSEQLQGRKDKAVRFTENVLGDPDRAAEIEDESLEDYADRRHIQIKNPHRRTMIMAKNADLQERVDELEAENDALREQLDTIAEIVAPEDSDEEKEDEKDENEDSGDDSDDEDDDAGPE